MSEWEHIEGGVSWKSPPLSSTRLTREWLEGRFGPPCFVDLDSAGGGEFDAWLLRFPCGLEVSLWWVREGGLGAPAARPEEDASRVEIYANRPEPYHVARHVGLDACDLVWVNPDLPRRRDTFAAVCADDHGTRYELGRYGSRCEAEAVVAAFERLRHKQTYWVEPVEVGAARG